MRIGVCVVFFCFVFPAHILYSCGLITLLGIVQFLSGFIILWELVDVIGLGVKYKH